MGTVNRAVPHAELEATALEWGRIINGKSPTAQRMLKYAFNLLDDGLVGQQLFAGETTRLAYMTDEAAGGSGPVPREARAGLVAVPLVLLNRRVCAGQKANHACRPPTVRKSGERRADQRPGRACHRHQESALRPAPWVAGASLRAGCARCQGALVRTSWSLISSRHSTTFWLEWIRTLALSSSGFPAGSSWRTLLATVFVTS